MNIRQYIYDNHWTLGFFEGDGETLIKGVTNVHWLRKDSKISWFADPFILEVRDDEIILLVEEFPYFSRKGRISRISVNKKTYELQSVIPVLELDTHLSFPAYFCQNGKVYIYPENSASGALTLYEYDDYDKKCRRIKEICSYPLTDAVMTDYFNSEKVIFSTKEPIQNSNRLFLYKKNNDKYEEVLEFELDGNIARNAGAWFKVGQDVYRPAQDCNNRYGGGIIIQRISLTKAGLHFENIKKISFNKKGYKLGCHTFNSKDNMSVIDVNGYRRPYLAKLFLIILRIRKMLS